MTRHRFLDQDTATRAPMRPRRRPRRMRRLPRPTPIPRPTGTQETGR